MLMDMFLLIMPAMTSGRWFSLLSVDWPAGLRQILPDCGVEVACVNFLHARLEVHAGNVVGRVFP